MKDGVQNKPVENTHVKQTVQETEEFITNNSHKENTLHLQSLGSYENKTF